MSQSLQQQVEQVRTAALRLAWLFALSRVVTAAAVAAASLGLVDYLLRPHEIVFRWLLSAGVIGLTTWAICKFALPVACLRQSRVNVARRIEMRFPQLGGRLSSALAFLGQTEDDSIAGSPDLRRAVVAEAEALADQLDFRRSLDSRAAQRAAAFAAAALGIGGLLALLNPAAAALAAARLAMPWRELPWPRKHELAFVHPPQQLAMGDDVELTLIDRRGAPPDRVELLLRHDSPAGSRMETKEMKPLGERMVLRLDHVTRGFAYRARGGDDDTMPWSELAVVESPKIVELQVLVQPPAYCGLPPQSAGRVVTTLIGSRLTVRGRLDKSVRSAVVRAETAELPLPIVELAPDGLSFTAGGGKSAWMVERSGTLWFELTDKQGLVFGRDTRIELHAASDAPPSIAWESPGDHSFVTARALIPIQGIAKDDLALRNIQFRFLRPRFSDEEQVVDLYARQAASLPERAATTGRSLEGETQPFHYDWDLSRLAGLQPGDVLAARITAEDFKPQVATAVVRRLTIITDEELADRVALRQTAILGQLAEALRAAQQCREQTSAVEARWQTAEQLDAGDFNQLQSVQHNQEHVQRLLENDSDGAEKQIVSLLGELAANHAEDLAVGQRLGGLLAAVKELNRGLLPAISQELTEAIKTVREQFHSGRSASETSVMPAIPIAATQHLTAAGTKQDELIGALEKLLGTLNQWDSFSRLAREVGQIRDDEERLAAETEDLRTKAVAAAEIVPSHRAAARQLTGRQQGLARQLDKLQTRMEEMLKRVSAGDPLAGATLTDALDTARRLAIGGQMREAAARLSGLELSEARQAEQLVLDRLKQLLDSLSLRRDVELARTAASLRQAVSELDALRQRGAKAKADVDAAAASAAAEMQKRELARLSRTLEELSQASEQLARRLARLRAQRAATALGQAAAKAVAAAQAAGSGDPGQAQHQAEDAQRQLEQAVQELAQAVAQADEELAREQRARIEQSIAGLAARQTNVIAETIRLDGERDIAGTLGPAPATALRNLAAEQRLLAEETRQLRPRLAAAAAFELALEGAAEAMSRAGGLLGRSDTGANTMLAEQAALTYLEQILEALRPDEPGAASPPGGDEQQPGSPSPSGNLAGVIAELKLLKLLQEQINSRTSEIEAKRAAGIALTADEEHELATLARQQGRLADMTLGLIEATVPRPENQLERLQPAGPQGKSPDATLRRDLEK